MCEVRLTGNEGDECGICLWSCIPPLGIHDKRLGKRNTFNDDIREDREQVGDAAAIRSPLNVRLVLPHSGADNTDTGPSESSEPGKENDTRTWDASKHNCCPEAAVPGDLCGQSRRTYLAPLFRHVPPRLFTLPKDICEAKAMDSAAGRNGGTVYQCRVPVTIHTCHAKMQTGGNEVVGYRRCADLPSSSSTTAAAASTMDRSPYARLWWSDTPRVSSRPSSAQANIPSPSIRHLKWESSPGRLRLMF